MGKVLLFLDSSDVWIHPLHPEKDGRTEMFQVKRILAACTCRSQKSAKPWERCSISHQELRAALMVSVQLFVQLNQPQVDVVQLSLKALVLLVVALKFSLVAQALLFINDGRKHTLEGKKKVIRWWKKSYKCCKNLFFFLPSSFDRCLHAKVLFFQVISRLHTRVVVPQSGFQASNWAADFRVPANTKIHLYFVAIVTIADVMILLCTVTNVVL